MTPTPKQKAIMEKAEMELGMRYEGKEPINVFVGHCIERLKTHKDSTRTRDKPSRRKGYYDEDMNGLFVEESPWGEWW